MVGKDRGSRPSRSLHRPGRRPRRKSESICRSSGHNKKRQSPSFKQFGCSYPAALFWMGLVCSYFCVQGREVNGSQRQISREDNARRPVAQSAGVCNSEGASQIIRCQLSLSFVAVLLQCSLVAFPSDSHRCDEHDHADCREPQEVAAKFSTTPASGSCFCVSGERPVGWATMFFWA
jgi:hypothetical protein